MTKEDFNEQRDFIIAQYEGDPEVCHGELDELMEKVLMDLGYDVEPIRDTTRWYA